MVVFICPHTFFIAAGGPPDVLETMSFTYVAGQGNVFTGAQCPGSLQINCLTQLSRYLSWQINDIDITEDHQYASTINYPLILASSDNYRCFQVTIASVQLGNPQDPDDVRYTAMLNTDWESVDRYKIRNVSCRATDNKRILATRSYILFINFTLIGKKDTVEPPIKDLPKGHNKN